MEREYGRGVASGDDVLRAPAPPHVPEQLEPSDLARGVLEEDSRLEEVRLTGVAPTATVARTATIAGAHLSGSLAGARLAALHLQDTEAVGGDHANLDAPKAAFSRVAFRDCRLTGAQLSEASLCDATFASCRLDLAVLAGATLERVVFADCVLSEATLEQALLRDVRFERCDLTGATLGHIRLQRVELVGCGLAGVRSLGDLRGARMPWPDLVENAGELAAALGIDVLEEG